MLLEEFINNFIRPNSLVRLVYEEKKGHIPVFKNWEDVCMEWELLKNEGIYRNFNNNEVIGITDILVRSSNYSEAINIIIKPIDNIKDITNYVHEGH